MSFAAFSVAERRRDHRVALLREVDCEADGLRLRGRLADISAGGAFVEVLGALPEELTLRFCLEESEPPLSVRVRVLYVQEGTGAGCQFVDLPESERLRIEALVERRGTPRGREGLRRSERVMVYLPVALVGEDAYGRPVEDSAAIISLSRNGAALSVPRRPAEGMRLCLRSGAREFRGSVVWIKDSTASEEVQVGIQSRGLARAFGFDFPLQAR